jgi:hypothetical protein
MLISVRIIFGRKMNAVFFLFLNKDLPGYNISVGTQHRILENKKGQVSTYPFHLTKPIKLIKPKLMN